MPFNPGGVFSLVASYFASPGTTIRTEQHNPPLEDIAAGLSLVVIRDGRAPMTGALNMNGFPINNVAPGNSSGSVATLGQAMPLGGVIDFAGATAPAGWMLCYGQAISRVTYAALFAIIGTAFGAGDGSTTFNLPDLRGRSSSGNDSMGGTAANRITVGNFGATPSNIGSFGGLEAITLTPDQMPRHFHAAGIFELPHSHNYIRRGGVIRQDGTTAATVASQDVDDVTSANTTGVRVNSSNGLDTTYSTGGDGQHNNMQPTLILNKIIRVSFDG